MRERRMILLGLGLILVGAIWLSYLAYPQWPAHVPRAGAWVDNQLNVTGTIQRRLYP